MKVHYFNILLFALPLNILVNNQRNHKSPTSHTSKITTTRLLCECELYAPSNYDNDREMKEVMENFNKQTQQRFHEYDERMKTTRQKCKDNCEKEIQKIILKDKLEKQMEQQLTTLETKIDTDDIPSCICEKSMAHKVEKDCLRCGYGLGTVAPTVGLIGSVVIGAWEKTAIAAATKAAIAKGAAEGLAAGNAHGMNIVIKYLEDFYVKNLFPKIFEEISRIDHFSKVINFAGDIFTQKSATCSVQADQSISHMCGEFNYNFGFTYKSGGPKAVPGENPIPKVLSRLVERATQAADAVAESTTEEATAEAIKTSTDAIEAASTQLYSAIGYSVLAIIIIVLIIVIIYKILRYRRKKKMKKKLQYIKLLEE
ncbi:rifin [Plasmodium reichenowi]|uniref:Rifin n=1 Tax=Plasmodium reichenowi TaxID=5854 RepID=A0A060RQ57_PLARE|nr:rifin [Plasmodium reichenowi]